MLCSQGIIRVIESAQARPLFDVARWLRPQELLVSKVGCQDTVCRPLLGTSDGVQR